MQSFRRMLYGENGERPGARAYREAFLYQMVNYFDDMRGRLESGKPLAAKEAVNPGLLMTVEQKRRLRNRIYEKAVEIAGDDKDAVCDPRILSQAFFETDFGKDFVTGGRYDVMRCNDQTVSDRRPGFYERQWTPSKSTVTAYGKTNAIIQQWSYGNFDADGRPLPTVGILVSPYDPLFKHSEVFSEDSAHIGYVVADVDENGVPVAKGRGSRYLKDGLIESVYMPRTNFVKLKDAVVAEVDARVGAEAGDEPGEYNPDRMLEGKLSASGYLDIEHYVKTKDEKYRVRTYLTNLVESRSTDGKAGVGIRPDEMKFIDDVCGYLYSRGRDFTVDVDNGRLVAKLGSRFNIVLLSPEDGLFAGRIYDKGMVARLSIATDGGNLGPTQSALIARQVVTDEDRMNMIRWYFGERVPIVREDNSRTRSARALVGMADKKVVAPTVIGRMQSRYARGKDRYGGRGKAEGLSAVTRGTAQASDYSAVLSIRKSPDTNRLHEVVKISVSRPSPGLNVEFSNSFLMSDAALGEGGLREKISDERILPDPVLDYETEKDEKGKVRMEDGKPVYATDADGNRIVVMAPDGKPRLGRSEVARDPDYYRHVLVRNRLAAWVDSAKENHARMMDIDGMAEHVALVGADGDGPDYVFCEDDAVVELQEKALKFLKDAHAGRGWDQGFEAAVERLREDYKKYQDEAFGFVPEIEHPGVQVSNDHVPEGCMGLNPDMVVKYVDLSESTGVQRNQSFLIHMLARLEGDFSLEPGKETIRGDSYFATKVKNAMVRYDEEATLASIRLADVANDYNMAIDDEKFDRAIAESGLANQPFRAAALKETMRMLVETGCNPNTVAIRMDARGIMEYTGYVSSRATIRTEDAGFYMDGGDPKSINFLRSAARFDEHSDIGNEMQDHDMYRVSGQLGQVFEPDEYGAIMMDTLVPDDRVLIPGYNAYLVPSDPEQPKPMRDRLRLIGLQQQMFQAIDSTIRESVISVKQAYAFNPHTTELNSVYANAYGTVLDREQYLANIPEPGQEPTPEQRTFLNVIDTLKGRCRFPNEYGEGATTEAQSYLENPHTQAAKDFDYFYSDLCENHNLRVLGHHFDGVFDPNATGNAKTQGIVRYLAEGARIDSRTGAVVPYEGDDEAMKQCRLLRDPVFENMYFDSWDRRLMAFNQVLTALGTPRNVGTAMMNMQGWNFDDGFLVSKRFAMHNQITGADGQPRALMAQDKLSDFHGNKGVISKVVDPDMLSDRLMSRFGSMGSNYILVADEEGNELDLSDPRLRRATVSFKGKTYDMSLLVHDKGLSGADLVDARKRLIVENIQDAYGLKGMDDVMRVFADNPKLDVVQAPYSGMSRFNGGTVRDLMGETAPLVINKDGKTRTVPGGIGFTNFIVVDMPADVKTHIYDEMALLEGKGRKASGQLAWALQSKGCVNIMNEFYGQNQGALDDMREYAIAIGMDFDEKMRPVAGYANQDSRGERRALIKLPDLDACMAEMQAYKTPDKDGKVSDPSWRDLVKIDRSSGAVTLDKKFDALARNHMMDMLNKNGGFMELPFPIRFVSPEDRDFISSTDKTGQLADGQETYGYPVLPINLRSGMEMVGGGVRAHDYTNRYINIHARSMLYMACRRGFAEEREVLNGYTKKYYKGTGRTAAEVKKFFAESDKVPEDVRKDFAAHMKTFEALTAAMKKAQDVAQSEANVVTTDIVRRRFDTKHNVIRDGIMARRIPQSGTAVWSADPRLDLDQVAVGRAAAEKLGLLDDDGNLKPDSDVLVWRDPILHDDNVRYLHAVLDESLLGVAVNPLIDKPFDGDFDGDSVAIVPLKTAAARAEARRMFSMEANLLQKGVAPDENGDYPLYIQSGLDVKTVMAAKPELKDRFDELTREVNEFERARKAYEANPSEGNMARIAWTNPRTGEVPGLETCVMENRRTYMRELSALMHEALDDIGGACIDFTDERSVMSSLIDIADTKAKGDRSKLGLFTDNFGVELVGDAVAEKGWETEDKATVLAAMRPITKDGKTVSLFTRDGVQLEKDWQIQETAAYKADNTALGGTTAQQAMAAFRNVCPTAALELSYPTTQGILQSKHDPVDAKTKDRIVRFWGKDVWDGYELTGRFDGSPSDIFESPHNRQVVEVPTGDGGTARVFKKADPETWKRQMAGMFTALKVDFNPEYLDQMAKMMTRGFDVRVPDCTGAMDGDYVVRGQYGKGTVMGVNDFISERGSLMDRMAYRGRFKAFLGSAKEKDDTKRESLFGTVYDGAADLESAKRELRAATDRDGRAAARAKLAAARAKWLPAGATFVPDTFVTEAYYDAIRESTGKTTNTVVRGHGDDAVEVEIAPRPLGSRNCRLTGKQYEAGAAFMGEPETEYRDRLREAREKAEIAKKTAEDFDREAETQQMETAVAAMVGAGKPGTENPNAPK